MTFKTKVNKSVPKKESLRTTIPSSIVKQFNIKEGDTLEWEIKALKKNELIICVKKEE
jgi:bifunctional DNA-binding transcriptional regulator/antitoxin component of YhaV-PrlF toxin-antitoxin module